MKIIDRRRQTVAEEPEQASAAAAEASEQSVVSVAEVDRIYSDPLPIFDRILIKQGSKETTWGTAHIVIPDYVQKAPNMGAVVATAENYIVDGKAFPMSELVKQGDIVTFSQFNTEDVELDGEKFVLCSIFDVKLIKRVSYALGVSGAAGL